MSALTHFSLFSGIGGSRRVYHRMPVRMGGFPDGSFEKALAAGTKIPGHYHSDKGGIF
jgi:hypothetical protein